MFPLLGFLLGSHKKVMNNRKEFHDFIQSTFIEYLKDLDENDKRSFIDSYLVQQREVMDYFIYVRKYRYFSTCFFKNVPACKLHAVSENPSFRDVCAWGGVGEEPNFGTF